MTKNNLMVITVGLSLSLGGCMYSDTLAPIYSISSNNTPSHSAVRPAGQTNTAVNNVASIEQPSNKPVVVSNSQNPYGTPTRPAGTVRPDIPAPSTPDTVAMTDSAKAAAANDPRIKEASQVLANTTTTEQSVSPIAGQTARPNTVTPADAQQAVANTANTATATQAATTVAAATPPKPATAQSATKSLLQEARTSVAAGNYDKAASALERAHRIEPSNAKILYDIAQIRYAQGKYRQAESFASKAANYTKSPVLSKKIWTMLANSRKALGNSTGAAAAAQKAANF